MSNQHLELKILGELSLILLWINLYIAQLLKQRKGKHFLQCNKVSSKFSCAIKSKKKQQNPNKGNFLVTTKEQKQDFRRNCKKKREIIIIIIDNK